MRFITFIILFLLFSQVVVGQNECGNFKDYDESQKWIQKIKDLQPEERKNKILERIKCEQKSELNKIDFRLIILATGNKILTNTTANEIPNSQNEILSLIPADKYNIGHSLCESNVFPQNCNLGFVFIDRFDQPVINEIKELKNFRLKRRNGKIIIKLESEIEENIKIEVRHFLSGHSTILNQETTLKKGKNKFVFRRNSNLQLIKAKVNGKRLIIII